MIKSESEAKPAATGQLIVNLFHGRKDPEQSMEGWGTEPEVFLGPFQTVHVTYTSVIRCGDDFSGESCLSLYDDMVWYNGVFYGDWAVCPTSRLKLDQDQKIEAYDPVRAAIPPRWQKLPADAKLSDDFKRLLQAGQLGVRIYQEDGHRWLQWLTREQNEAQDATPWQSLYPRQLPAKIYGTAIDALDELDEVLESLGKPPLLEQFDKTWGYDDGWREAWGFYKKRGG